MDILTKNDLIIGKKSKKTTLLLTILEPNKDLLKIENIDILKGYPNESHNDLFYSYKTIILFGTRGLEISKLFSFLDLRDYKRILKKIKVVEIEAKTPYNDINEFVNSLGLTDRAIKRTLLKSIKQQINSNAYDCHIRAKKETLDLKGLRAINTLNLTQLRSIISQKALLSLNFLNEGLALIKRNIEPNNPIYVNLKGKYLSDNAMDIYNLSNEHDKLLIGSPTGTGKSYFIKRVLTEFYDRTLILSPFSLVTRELGDDKNVFHISNKHLQFQVLSLLKHHKHISMTTDKLYNLLNSEFKDEVEEYLRTVDVFVFDEQHVVEHSKNFRGKVVATAKLLDNFQGKKMFFSGTPIYKDLPHYTHVVVKPQHRHAINYYDDPFNDESELLEKIKETVKTSNTLVYASTIVRAKELLNYFTEAKIECVMVTSRGNLYKGKIITNKELYSLNNVVIIGTSRITTGVNIPTLNTIFQIGTPYNTDTFVQLVARIRGNGSFYKIKTMSGNDRYSSVTNKALHILNRVMEFQAITSEGLVEKLNKDRVDFNDTKDHHKQFLSIYRNALALIASKGMGAWNRDKSLFTFILPSIENIDEAFKDTETVNYHKFIDRLVVNDIQAHVAVDKLNDLYNLSFNFVVHRADREVDPKRLITSDDLMQKQEENKSEKDRLKKLEEDTISKLSGVLTTESSVKAFKRDFTYSEMLQLLKDDRLDNKKVIDVINQGSNGVRITDKEKLLRLKFFLIDKKSIIDIALNALKTQPYLTVSDLSDAVEKQGRLTARRSKKPFYFFIKDLFDNTELNNKMFIGNYKARIEGRQLFKRNVLMLTETAREEFINNQENFKQEIYSVIELSKSEYKDIEIEIVDTKTNNTTTIINGEIK